MAQTIVLETFPEHTTKTPQELLQQLKQEILAEYQQQFNSPKQKLLEQMNRKLFLAQRSDVLIAIKYGKYLRKKPTL